MKAVILFCVVALAFAYEEKTCLEEPDGGMCRGYFEMYYYDYKTRSCKQFIYGGCGGNGNRYATEEECMDKCRDVVVFETEPVCEYPAETGRCFGYFPRYHFDKTTGECKQFIYGGCGGNANNFKSKEECEDRCGTKSSAPSACQEEKVVGPCRAHFPRFYFNKETGKCEEFVYGGCNGNSNNFLSQEDCEAVCSASAPSVCEQEKVVGPCKAGFPRYYFNKETGKCENFIYGGCQGNENNFYSQEECEEVCSASAPTICEQEKVVGPCRGFFPRYYHNKETGKCEKFIYGGCQGNENNFETQEECEEVCSTPVSSACEQEKIVGPCKAALSRFYYNKETGKCEAFIYGGCQGNDNNFQSQEDCEAVCST